MDGGYSLAFLVLRTLSEKQILILSRIGPNRNEGITSILRSLSAVSLIPLSTLKLNARKLRDLGLIDFSCGESLRPAVLTGPGKSVFAAIRRRSPVSIGDI